MPYFDFSVTKKQTNTNHKKAKQYTIIKRDIYGVVHIAITGMLFVNINNTVVPILKDCYNTAKKDKIFSLKLNKDSKRLCIVRNKNERLNYTNENYLPFAPGCVVYGNLLLNPYGTTLFNIKKVIIEWDNEESRIAFNYWKTNYEEIERNRNKNK